MDIQNGITIKRWHIAIFLLLVQLWPVGVMFEVFNLAPFYKAMFADQGGQLPEISEFFFNTYRFWIAVPIITLILAIASMHPKNKTMALPLICVAITTVLTFGMHIIMKLAIYIPQLQLITTLSK